MKKVLLVLIFLGLPRMLFVESLPLIEQTIEARCMVCQRKFTVVSLHPYFLEGSFGYICSQCRKKESKGREDKREKSHVPALPWDRNADQSYEESKAALEYYFLYEKAFGSSSLVRQFTVGEYVITFPSGCAAAGTIKEKNSKRKKLFRLPKDTRGRTLQITSMIQLEANSALVKTDKGDAFLRYDFATEKYTPLTGFDLAVAACADLVS